MKQVSAILAAREAARNEELDCQADSYAKTWDQQQLAVRNEDGYVQLVSEANRIEALGYANFIGLHSSADQAFTVDPRLWQAALFKASVLSRPSWYDHDPSVSVGEARGVRFRTEAMNRLGPEAESWLGARRKTDGVTRFNAAQASDTVFAQLIVALEKAAAERADRISRKQRAEAARQALKERASEALGEDRAAVFVATTHPAIGAHPNDYCVDELTLAECVRLLKPAKPRRR